MKRREAKFVSASPCLSPDRIKAAPHVRETRPRSTDAREPATTRRAAPASSRRRKP